MVHKFIDSTTLPTIVSGKFIVQVNLLNNLYIAPLTDYPD
jgi:hypothetical protein